MANTRVYFMSVDDLKSYSTIDYSVESKLLENSIYDAQKIDIQAIIGTRLYKSLEDKIIDGTISSDTNYQLLLDDYIFDTLLKASQKRALMFIFAKIRNKGVMEQSSDNSNPVDITILNKLKDEIANDFEFYSNKLKDFLCEEQDTYIEYRNYNPDSKKYFETPNKEDSYFSGLYLGGTIKRDWRNDA